LVLQQLHSVRSEENVDGVAIRGCLRGTCDTDHAFARIDCWISRYLYEIALAHKKVAFGRGLQRAGYEGSAPCTQLNLGIPLESETSTGFGSAMMLLNAWGDQAVGRFPMMRVGVTRTAALRLLSISASYASKSSCIPPAAW